MPGQLLSYLNSLPCRLTVKHYQTFGDATALLKDGSLDSAQSWDALRLHHPHFTIDSTREQWLQAAEAMVKKDGQDGKLIDRAQAVAQLIGDKQIAAVFATGVGGGGLEYQIKKALPEIKLICSEYAVETVARLQKVFLECEEIVTFDILTSDWKLIKEKYFNDTKGAVLMYRLDAGFTDRQWRAIFVALHQAGIEHVIYIPTGFLTARSLGMRKWRTLRWRLGGQAVSFAGYLRTKRTFQGFWAGLYQEEVLDFAGLTGFFLSRNRLLS